MGLRKIISECKNKSGFTLAEVLITLGIIGIVAAMTLPALIQKHKKRVVETKLSKFYSVMNQAVLRSVADNGETKYWQFPDVANANNAAEIENFYNIYLKKYLKVLKVDTLTGINSYPVFTIFFSDGSVVYITYSAHDWTYCMDLESAQHSGNNAGRKCFIFGFYPAYNPSSSYTGRNYHNKGIEPYVSSYIIDETGNTVPFTEKDLYKQKRYSKIIQLNGWKIPDDYPLRF